VLLYPQGDCYGYVSEADVPTIIDTAILGKKRVLKLWRGAIGMSEHEQAAFREAW